MDLSKVMFELKSEPGFREQVGMILIHNGVVRGYSRDGKKVKKLKVSYDYEKIYRIKESYEKRDGIFKILIEAREGEFFPGDDLLWIVVAGDIRENVKRVLSEVLRK